MFWLICFFTFIFGAVIGSFLNVCIYRIPLKKSIVSPPSSCPGCGHRLSWIDLIPVISYLALCGKCRQCGVSISYRYCLVEVLTGSIFMMAFLKFGLGTKFLTAIILASLMIVIAFIDIDHRIIPNRLVVFGLISGIIMGFLRPNAEIYFMFFGTLTGFGLMFLIALASRGQMGFGDVKLAAVMGVFLGWQGVLLAIFLAFFTGAVYGVLLILFKGQGRKTAVPFGPFLACATVASFLWANQMISWYLKLVT